MPARRDLFVIPHSGFVIRGRDKRHTSFGTKSRSDKALHMPLKRDWHARERCDESPLLFFWNTSELHRLLGKAAKTVDV